MLGQFSAEGLQFAGITCCENERSFPLFASLLQTANPMPPVAPVTRIVLDISGMLFPFAMLNAKKAAGIRSLQGARR